YRAFANLEAIQADVEDLIRHLAGELAVKPPSKVESLSVQKLFKKYCDFELKPETGIPEFKKLAEKLSVDVRSAETVDDYFFLIFMEKVESQLNPEHLIFVKDYPPYQAALARLTPTGWG